MRYVDAKRKEHRDRLLYRAYITEAVRNISENVARGLGQEAYMARSYMDIISPTPEPTDEPTPGDMGIVIFAILGVLAIAGAAVVIKVRK